LRERRRAYMLGKLAKVCVAWGEFAPCVTDPYHRPTLKDIIRQSLID